MAGSLKNMTFSRMIDLRKCDFDMKSLLSSYLNQSAHNYTRRFIPSLVNVKLIKSSIKKYDDIVRSIMSTLKKIQLESNVRFCSELDTLMKYDCGDIFYSDRRELSHKDLDLFIKPISTNYVEISVRVYSLKKTHLDIRKLSNKFYYNEFGGYVSNSSSGIRKLMDKQLNDEKLSNIVTRSNDYINILLIPSPSHDSFCYIPIFGLSEKDAIRISLYSDREFRNTNYVYREYGISNITDLSIMKIIASEITQASNNLCSYESIDKIYKLSEILTGYQLRLKDGHRDNGSIGRLMWFDNVYSENDDLVVYDLPIVSKKD